MKPNSPRSQFIARVAATAAAGVISLVGFCGIGFAQTQSTVPEIAWQSCFGDWSDDYLFSIVPSPDGGYIACGYTLSNTLPRYHAQEDAYVVKMNAYGNLEWQKCYGGSGNEEAYQIIVSREGGYALAITSESSDGDVPNNYGSRDAWILKLDDTGKIEWSQDFGGTDWDEADGITENADFSYVFCGSNRGVATEGSSHYGSAENDDGWLIKLNAPEGAGNFQRYIGGTRLDHFFSVITTKAGNLAIAGMTNSYDGDATGLSHIDTFYNVWVCQLDQSGKIQWQKQYGGSNTEWANCIQQTRDSGYIVAGATESSDGDVRGYHGGYDGWVFKIDSIGTLQWQRCLGGTQRDGIRWIVQDSDGGYTAAGTTASSDGDVTSNYGNYDGWIVKLDSTGQLLWQKCVGGSNVDILHSIAHTPDGGFIAAGQTISTDGNVSGGHGGYDGWVVKFRSPTSSVASQRPVEQELSVTASVVNDGNSIAVNYHAPSDMPLTSIEISNVLGVMLREWSGQSTTNSISFVTSDLPSGMYFVTLRAFGQAVSRAVQLLR